MIRTVTSHCIPMRKGKFINCLSSGGTTQTLGICSKPKAVVQFYVSIPYDPWGQRQELLCFTDLAACLGHAVCKTNICWLNEGEMRLKKKNRRKNLDPTPSWNGALAHSCFSATRGSVVLRDLSDRVVLLTHDGKPMLYMLTRISMTQLLLQPLLKLWINHLAFCQTFKWEVVLSGTVDYSFPKLIQAQNNQGSNPSRCNHYLEYGD